MARAGRSLVVCAVSAVIMIVVSADHAQGLGVNWGTMASHPLHPTIVVNLLKDNGIKKVKLFDADDWTVSSLAGSGIEVMVAIPNDQLNKLASSYNHAKDWVKENVTKHLRDNGGVDIRYVGVGNEPFLSSYNGSFLKPTFPALKNVQKALNKAGVGDKIKATIPLNADIYDSSSNTPSDGNFRDDIRDLMIQIVRFLNDNKSPFMVNIYPFLSLYQNSNFPQEFAFFDGSKTINDKNTQYDNVFDANHDTLVWSLRKAGVPDLKILVGEVGWPTDGDKNANVGLAKKFYDGLLKKLAKNKGTPLRPGRIETYLFSLLDEDIKSVAPGHFERHWGIFRYDGQPKFAMDFTGQGQDKMLVVAKGVQYLEKKWCVLGSDVKNMSAVGSEVNYACSMSDCTSLGPGTSCGELNEKQTASYAFNMYFQMNDQSVEACDFSGMAKIVTQNASHGNCLFPIQIESCAERLGFRSAVTVVAGALLSLFMFM
ncbi:Glucan endo-1,3-beta-glucosidase 8 [Morus notabilis]|uniref:glucan endo-1,3-beta-D-glucosidase n=1 Tax=Morus notabilis TaxID=981085 RepID=W9QC19_9ROSA|nr:glucan endo-1,3-beta-glucosidase 8 [Morus notabilis]EXB24800.1 Glucan endo-1,3-beta-glucosidase 8 [Morus notabilis]